MKIFLNGDSNMAGAEIPRDQPSVPSTLVSLLKANEVTNMSYTGGSNDRIYNTTMEYFNRDTADFAIIGWSDFARLQWFIETEHGYDFYEANRLGVGKPVPIDQKDRLSFWKNKMKNDGYFHRYVGMYWHEKIRNMHLFLKYKKVPHLFFLAFNPFTIDEELKIDWDNEFLGPYDKSQSYINWCQEHGYQEITPGKFHYESKGQQAWAEYLFQHITQHNLI